MAGQRDTQDHYFREARREGYRSRAAYKLIEIDDRRRILARGAAVLDCGAAPGSWLQVAANRIGPRGRVVGIDLQRIQPDFREGDVRLVEADFTEVDAATLLGLAERPAFDVVLSDMAPSTTGDHTIDHHASIRLCRSVLGRLDALLAPGGSMVMKVFEGEAYPELLEHTRARFERAKGFSPKASRSESREMFVVATGFRGAADEDAADEPAPARRPPTPPPGWKS